MKIFVASSVHIWHDNRIFHKEVKSLAKKYEVELHAVAPFKYKVKDGINIFGLKEANNRFYRLWRSIILFFRIFNSNCKIVHFHDFELVPLGLFIKLIPTPTIK